MSNNYYNHFDRPNQIHSSQYFDSASWRQEKPKEYVLYVIVRNLSSMTPGKAMAHSAHAACAFLHETVASKETIAWKNSTGQGFGTQINLKGNDEDTEAFIKFAAQNGAYSASKVVDPTYPYVVKSEMFTLIANSVHTIPPKYNETQEAWLCHRNEWTASYIFCDKNDKNIKDHVAKFTWA